MPPLGLIFYGAMLVYFILFVVVGFIFRRWSARVFGWLILLSPLLYWMREFPVIQYRHEQFCKKDGGLRILIQPEKVDRIQLDGRYFDEHTAHSLLKELYPRLRYIEAPVDNVLSNDQYYLYSIDEKNSDVTKKLFKFAKQPLEKPTPRLFILTKASEIQTDGGYRIQSSVIRTGQTFLTWTSYQYRWESPGLPGILPHEFRCFFGNYDPNQELINVLIDRSQ